MFLSHEIFGSLYKKFGLAVVRSGKDLFSIY